MWFMSVLMEQKCILDVAINLVILCHMKEAWKLRHHIYYCSEVHSWIYRILKQQISLLNILRDWTMLKLLTHLWVCSRRHPALPNTLYKLTRQSS